MADVQFRDIPDDKPLPNLFRISFFTEVVPEPGDTLAGLLSFVHDLGTEWLPEGFVFDIEYQDPTTTEWTEGKRTDQFHNVRKADR